MAKKKTFHRGYKTDFEDNNGEIYLMNLITTVSKYLRRGRDSILTIFEIKNCFYELKTHFKNTVFALFGRLLAELNVL
jgi:hypothetical protein